MWGKLFKKSYGIVSYVETILSISNYVNKVFLRTLFVLCTFLDTPWVLLGIILALSSVYAIALVVGLVYGCVKCIKLIQLKIIQFKNQQRENSEPNPVDLRIMQERVQQLLQNLQQHQV